MCREHSKGRAELKRREKAARARAGVGRAALCPQAVLHPSTVDATQPTSHEQVQQAVVFLMSFNGD